MKKILSIISSVLIALTIFAVPSFAKTNDTVAFSDDFSYVYYNGTRYIATDSRYFYINDYAEPIEVTLTKEQKQKIKAMSITPYDSEFYLEANYLLNNNTSIYCTYINEYYYKHYQNAIEGKVTTVYLRDVLFNEELTFNLQNLLQNKTSILVSEDSEYDCYNIIYQFFDGDVEVDLGVVFKQDDKYYFLDYATAGIEFIHGFDFSMIAEKNVTVYEITDEESLSTLDSALGNSSETRPLFDDNTTMLISGFLLIFIFGIIPLGLLILFLILALRSKTKYRKIFLTLSLICILQITVFSVLFFMIM